MLHMLWPLGLVVLANTLYNICTKSTPAGANAFLSLTVTYLLAAMICIGIYFLGAPAAPLGEEIKKLNWSSIALALSIVALEFGYICVYRAGWKMNIASLTGNICLACVLVFVGALLYGESISLRQIAGILVCTAGLILLGT